MKFVKKNKPVTKTIWKFIQFLPSFLRKKVVRSQFELNYKLSSDYVFKVAETEEEIEQALSIVYESYSLLGYIDDRPEKLHFNAYLCLPTTTILVLKYKSEVVGTLSIVPDSPFGLPSEVTWDLSEIKAKSMRIAEISSLSIKKSHKSSKGHLLLTLCKFMYEYCVKVLELDSLVIAATQEVEPFYTDLLLFKKVVSTTGQEHKSVKGNKSTCCYINLNEGKKEYAREYGFNKRNKNFYYFFTGFRCPNIRLPDDRLSIHAILSKKNKALIQVLEKFPSLKESFSIEDKLTIANMDPTFNFDNVLNLDPSVVRRIFPRISIKKLDVILFHFNSKKHFKAQLTDISAKGFGIKCLDSRYKFRKFDQCVLIIQTPNSHVTVICQVQWSHDRLSGYSVAAKSMQFWESFTKVYFDEVGIGLDHQVLVSASSEESA